MDQLIQTIAVVIPTYNRRRLLSEAIQSCLTLSNPGAFRLEVVVVDDGSTDGTSESLVHNYHLEKDDHISKRGNLNLLTVPNGERGLARNLGAQHAINHLGADWLIFLDADDCLDRQGIRLLIPYLGSYDFVSSQFVVWFGADRFGPAYPKRLPEKSQDPWYFLEHDCIPLGATLISSQFFLRMGGFVTDRNLCGSEDKVLLLRCALWGKGVFSPTVTVWYRRHENNTSIEKISRSMSMAIGLLETDILRRFPDRAPKAMRIYKRHVAYLFLGSQIGERSIWGPLKMWLKIAQNDPIVICLYRHWRYLFSIISFRVRENRLADLTQI